MDVSNNTGKLRLQSRLAEGKNSLNNKVLLSKFMPNQYNKLLCGIRANR